MRTIVARPGPRLLLTACAALGLVGILVARTSQAAFTASTSNEFNTWHAGTVVLTDDDEGAAMFEVAGMVPGDVVEHCIQVTYEGTVTDPARLDSVRLYGGGYTQVPGPDDDSDGLAGHLRLTVDLGTGASFGHECAGFEPEGSGDSGQTVAGFAASHPSYGFGVAPWTPEGTPSSRSYRFRFELDADTPDSEQGAGVTDVEFVWEIRTS